MKPPDQVRGELVREWLAKASIDFRTASSLLDDADPIRESIAFHCQQAAEKYLKALLVHLRTEFPKTHDLEELLDLLAPNQPAMAVDLEPLVVLSPFGVSIRYPGDFPDVLPSQEREFFQLAEKARATVTEFLKPKIEI